MYVIYSHLCLEQPFVFYFFVITPFFPLSLDLFLSFFPSGHMSRYLKIASFNC